jgi:DNA-binding NarL/FixJ family response regulator
VQVADGCGVELTSRECAVLSLLAEGLTALAIGRRLIISERTVHKHLQCICRKPGVSDRVAELRHGAALWAPAR